MLPGLPTAVALLPLLALIPRARGAQAALWGVAGVAVVIGVGGADGWGGPLSFALSGALAPALATLLLAHGALADRAAGPVVAAVTLALTATDPRLSAAA
ncbi:MAG: hypothetical protein KC613_15220, partial [Myxococcales bacterium]|nr:hypothetical protein [Myxococcales bacterium]